MFIGSARKSLVVAGLFIGTLTFFFLGAFSAKILLKENQSNLFLTEGFDFARIRSADIEWRGPEIGDHVDLTRLRGKEGKSLKDIVDKRPIMLVSTNPDCGMCRTASDEMNHLRVELLKKDIKYYVTFFPAQIPQVDFFKYSASLNLDAESFLWDAEAGPPPPAIVSMTNPSHLLLNSDGTIIRVWPGSYSDKRVRERMARQILADTFVVIDTLNALQPKDVSMR